MLTWGGLICYADTQVPEIVDYTLTQNSRHLYRFLTRTVITTANHFAPSNLYSPFNLIILKPL